MLELLEADILPSLLRMYFNVDDPGARSLVKMIRSLWKTSLGQLQEVINEIIHPVAYCVVLEEEATRIATRVTNTIL